MNRKRIFITGLLLSLASGVWADVSISIRGSIIEPTCSVTNVDGASRTEVNFGLINIDDIGSARAQQPLQMKVACISAAPAGKTLRMYVKPTAGGTMAYSGRTVLGTSMPGLGIDLVDSHNVAVTPETWAPMADIDTGTDTPSGGITLLATLVSTDVSRLTAGDFTAAASVMMAYQ